MKHSLAQVLAGVALLTAIACNGSSPTAAPPPGEPPPPDSTLVGVVGCSQTTTAWRGWIETGDDGVWRFVLGYAGGDIVKWAGDIPNGDYWMRLDANIAGNGQATAVWWQICDRLLNPGTTADAEAVLAEIQHRVPGASVYASPLAEFERPETCTKMNLPNSNALVDHLVNSGLAQRGPDLPLVLDAWIQPPQGDGECHVGADGRAAFGAALAAFNW